MDPHIPITSMIINTWLFFSFVIPISPHISILSQIILNKSWILFLLQIFQYGIAKL